MDPPPAKKLRPYVTKWERKKAAESAQTTVDTSDCTYENDSDLKHLFLTDETILEYQDKYHRSSLPRLEDSQAMRRKPWKRKSGSGECVWCIRWCNKYSHLLAATCGNHIKLFDVLKYDDIRCVHSISHCKKFRHCEWSRCGRQLLTCAFSEDVKVYDFLQDGKLLHQFKVDTHPSIAKWWQDDDHTILLGGDESFLKSYDVRTGKEVANYSFKCGKILSFDFFSGGNYFMSSGDLVNRQSAEHNLIVWDTRMGAKISNQIYHERYTCPCVRSHPSGSVLLAQTTGNYIARFSAQKPFRMDKFIRYQNHTVNEYPVAFDFSRDGSFVFSGSSNGSVVCYKTNNGNYMRTIPLSASNETSCVDLQCHPVLPSTVAVSDWSGRINIIT